jgi:hypothetical protein
VRGRIRKEAAMLVFGVLVFSIVTFFISFLIVQTGEGDKGKIATLVTLTAWTSLAVGLLLGRIGQ